MRGATRGRGGAAVSHPISIHAPHARSDQRPVSLRPSSAISIHAPHARSDSISRNSRGCATDFNPRSSCEERLAHPRVIVNIAPNFNPRSSCEERLPARRLSRSIRRFQSTLLMRGATVSCTTTTPFFYDFNPRSSCEERPYRTRQFRRSRHFNPRSSCEERPAPSVQLSCSFWYFNPRSSCEERLGSEKNLERAGMISIHAPHARSDNDGCRASWHLQISIHAPHARSDR